ncbi:MAG: hypothetical protein UU87_C0003G0066 [Parcubacteria group bacterium GW2011_GWA2_42_11]|nr:MAG: hypothetical protein UU87_C0003G0066 [Parcubacteria group bacterium GW2011_GWA2_42_11]
MAPAKKNNIDERLSEIRRREEEGRAELLAQKLDLPYINLAKLPVDLDSLLFLNEKEALQARLAVIDKMEKNIKVILAEPDNPATKSLLEKLEKQGFKISKFIVSPHSLDKAFKLYKSVAKKEGSITGKVNIDQQELEKIQQELASLAEIKKKMEAAQAAQREATELLEIIIAGALQNEASDTHLEGKENGALLRYRIDGVLHDVVSLSPKTYQLVLSRIKLLSAMVLNIHDKAQDGRFSIGTSTAAIEVRVSIIPGPYGENVVMRLLNPKSINLGLKDLGFREDMLKFIEQEIKRPNGMIVTTGPTGSGKTTALYAFLREVTDPEIKIITLEDPIEYHLAGITQTQVETEHGYTFAAGLRAILRQDPDMVLVGEIRDTETAEIAIQAALTGHIVFSTLHTNDAAGAIPRFIDMGANPTTLSAALIDIMAQRLLRRICPSCKKEYEPSAEEKEKVKKALTGLPPEVKIPDISKGFKLYKGAGCPACNNTGYKGRVGIYELIPVDAEIEKLITKSPSHAEVLELAQKKGFISMYKDGMIKVLAGISTLEELDDIVGKQV